jgi:hypothetical protein
MYFEKEILLSSGMGQRYHGRTQTEDVNIPEYIRKTVHADHLNFVNELGNEII